MSLPDDLEFAHKLADAADAISMSHFRDSDLEHEVKPDGSPVTIADLQVEEHLRSLVGEVHPEDGFVGEEVGSHGSLRRRWIVDGIDGTVVFVAKQAAWATQIALEEEGRVVLGVSTSPAQGRRWWASLGHGGFVGTPEDRERGRSMALAVSARASLEGARCSLIPPLQALEGDRLALAELLVSCGIYVPPVGHGAKMVAEGEIDLCLQLAGGPWDFAALAIIVEEAGGRFSDLEGRWSLEGGGPVIFSNGHIHTSALKTLEEGVRET